TEHGAAVFRLEEHVDRLLDSAHIVGFRDLPWNREGLIDAIHKTIAANQFAACYIRRVIYLDCGMNLVVDSGRPRLLIAVWEWKAFFGAEAKARGIRANIASFTRLHPNIMMTKAKVGGNYVSSILAKTESQRAGFDEAIMLDPQGFVAECTGENIFVARKNVIYTVPRGAILEGITRDTLITVARDLGYEIVEEPISRDQLYLADEVFVCGTAAEVIALREIDFRTIGDGKTAQSRVPCRMHSSRRRVGGIRDQQNGFPTCRRSMWQLPKHECQGASMKKHQHRQETKAGHGQADLSKKNGPLATPIYQISTCEFTDNDQQLRSTHPD